MDLPAELKNLQGKRLTTLYQNKPFEITQISSNQIILKTSTKTQHPIPLQEIERAWKYLQKYKKLSRSQVGNLGFSETNPAYVVAILANLPGVKYSLSPIILKLN